MSTSQFWSCSDRGIVTLPSNTTVDLRNGILSLEYICDTFIDCRNWSDERSCSPSIVDAYVSFFVIFALLGGSLLVAVFIVIRSSAHRVIKKASPTFLICLLFGGGLGFVSMIPWTGYPNLVSCNFRAWLPGLAFVFGWGSLFAKTYRIHKIFNNKELRKVRNVSDRDMFVIVAILLAVEIFIFGLWAILSPWEPRISTIAGKPHFDCDTDYKIPFLVVLFFYKIALMIWGCKLAYDTRAVDSEFSESKYIFISIFTWLGIGVVVIPILFLPILGDDRLTAFVVRSLALCIAIGLVEGLLFIPKFVAMRRLVTETENPKLGDTSENRYRAKYLDITPSPDVARNSVSAEKSSGDRGSKDVELSSFRGSQARDLSLDQLPPLPPPPITPPVHEPVIRPSLEGRGPLFPSRFPIVGSSDSVSGNGGPSRMSLSEAISSPGSTLNMLDSMDDLPRPPPPPPLRK